ncbi:hypothetical protein RchiOBHm_Chr6g0247911 [Rosa chinensis]|uniref:Uncharacterized protein n=1 Tax=Rosa chinensis TaxID=74649 RepID=A0A2P6PJX2_ROSCH|nr:hypothetical protein RchiOBHm_Chr6g0247911 [Rosa chinensis]
MLVSVENFSSFKWQPAIEAPLSSGFVDTSHGALIFTTMGCCFNLVLFSVIRGILYKTDEYSM